MIVALMIAALAAQFPPLPPPPPVIVTPVAPDELPPEDARRQVDRLSVRISSPQGVLWQRTVMVSENEHVRHQQHLHHATAKVCDVAGFHDREERASLEFRLFVQRSERIGRHYRVDVDWARVVDSEQCSEGETRTVGFTRVLVLAPGETAVIEGDAGLRAELTRAR